MMKNLWLEAAQMGGPNIQPVSMIDGDGSVP